MHAPIRRVSSEKSLRALRRTMAKPNAKVQLLALTVRASYDQIRALDFLATVQSAVQDERKKDKDHFLRCLCGIFSLLLTIQIRVPNA